MDSSSGRIAVPPAALARDGAPPRARRAPLAAALTEGGSGGGALALALVYAAVPTVKGLIEAFSGPYVVQDDARQFLFWMRRWFDPALFAGDLNAQYWQGVTPVGYQAIFRAAALLGIDPMVLDKLLPAALALGLAYGAFRLAYRIVPVPAAALTASALTVFFMELMEDTASGMPRGFAVPLFLAFLCCLVERRTGAVAAVALLLGLVYPQMSLVCPPILALSLLRSRGDRAALSRDRGDWHRAAAGCAAVLLSLLPFLIDSGAFGPPITLAEARGSPAFQPGGRSEFFLPDPIDFYLCGVRSGLLPVQWGCHSAYAAGLAIAPALAVGELVFALGLPAWLCLRAGRQERGAGRPGRDAWVLAAAVASGTALFIAAHVLLFRLHLPARYGQHTLRAVSMVGLGVALAPAFVRLGRWAEAGGTLRRRAAAAAAFLPLAGLFAATILLPFIPRTEYVHGRHPALYAFIAAQPKDAVVASLSTEADNLPAFTGRTVLATREYAVPYSTGYIRPLRERTAALIRAAYASDSAAILAYLDRFGASLLLFDADAFTPGHVAAAWWRHDFPEAAAAASASLAGGRTPALARLLDACASRPDPDFIVMIAACLRSHAE